MKKWMGLVAAVCVCLASGMALAQEAVEKAPVKAPEKAAPAYEVVFDAGVGEAKAAELRGLFEKLMAENGFDVGERYGMSRSFTFTITVPAYQLMVLRDGQFYRVYLNHGNNALAWMVGNNGAIVVGEEGGQEVLQVLPGAGFSVVMDRKEGGTLKFRPALETNQAMKGVFSLRVTRILAAHLAKNKRVHLKEIDGCLVLMIDGPEYVMTSRYDMKARQLEDFDLVHLGRGSVLRVHRFMVIDEGAAADGIKLAPAGIKVEGTKMMVREGPQAGVLAEASYARLCEPENAKLMRHAQNALGLYGQGMMQTDLSLYFTYGSQINVREMTVNLLDGRLITAGDVSKVLDEVVSYCRATQISDSLTNYKDRRYLAQVLSDPVVGKTPSLALRRQLLLADAFMTYEQMGVEAKALTGVDALVGRFLEGAPRRVAMPETGIGEYVETPDTPAWLRLLSRVDKKSLESLPDAQRCDLVIAGLDELEAQGSAYLSTARVLSNVLKDKVVRKALSVGMLNDIQAGKVEVVEKRLAMLLTEDAEPENRAWLSEVTEVTLGGLKSQALTNSSVTLLNAIRSERGAGPARVAVREMQKRPDPAGLVKGDAAGARDLWNELKCATGRTRETVIEKAYAADGTSVVEVYLGIVVLQDDLPWKWRREVCRRLGLAFADNEKNAANVQAIYSLLHRMQYMPEAFMGNARWSLKRYLLESAKPEKADWMRAGFLLFTDHNCLGVLKLLEVKNRKGMARLLRDEALVKENLEGLKAQVREVKVSEPVVWLEDEGDAAKTGSR
jgi:hypothetical protein